MFFYQKNFLQNFEDFWSKIIFYIHKTYYFKILFFKFFQNGSQIALVRKRAIESPLDSNSTKKTTDKCFFSSFFNRTNKKYLK